MNKFCRKIIYGWEVLVHSCWNFKPSDVPIDVLIPVCEKDLLILPLALQGLREQVKHPIAAIYIIATDSGVIKDFCRLHNCCFVDEASVLGYTAKDLDIKIMPEGRDRSGWIFQQLLKLSGKIGHSPYFLTLDADHILLRPHVFLTKDGKTIFYGSREYHHPYYENIKSILGFIPKSRLSYVAHKMLFDRKQLAVLRSRIEERMGKPWDKAICESLDRTQISGFSEFELYGNFFPKQLKLQLPWCAHSLTIDKRTDYETLRHKYRWWYAAVTFPDYRKKQKK